MSVEFTQKVREEPIVVEMDFRPENLLGLHRGFCSTLRRIACGFTQLRQISSPDYRDKASRACDIPLTAPRGGIGETLSESFSEIMTPFKLFAPA
jgi:hypothetical protein